MGRVEAIYAAGVFIPLGKVDLAENQKVELTFQPCEKTDLLTWLKEVQVIRQKLLDRHGYFPDSCQTLRKTGCVMSDIVIDSSVATKWVLPESDSTIADQLVSDSVSKGYRLIILDIVLAEVTNAIWVRYHRKLTTLDQARQFLDDFRRVPVHVEPSERLLRSALEIAAKYHRAVYDSLFVALAHNLNLPGVTADVPLYHAVHADFPQIILLRDWQP